MPTGKKKKKKVAVVKPLKPKAEKGEVALARVYEDTPENQRFVLERRKDWKQNLNATVKILHKTIRGDGVRIPCIVFIARKRVGSKKRKGSK